MDSRVRGRAIVSQVKNNNNIAQRKTDSQGLPEDSNVKDRTKRLALGVFNVSLLCNQAP